MKKFRFSLERVLEYRSQVESARLRAFSKAVEVFQRRQEELRKLGDEMTNYRTRLAEMGVGKISANELARWRSYLSHCEVGVARAARWMMEAAGEMEVKRRDLVAAKKDTRVLERLKEIKREQYDYEAAREETKVLDEVAAAGFVASRASGGELT